VRFSPFRRARPASRTWNAAKTLVQITVLWSLALWIVPVLIAGMERRWLPASRLVALPRFGLTALLICSTVGLWAGWAIVRDGEGTPLPLDTTRRLVTRGPYAFVRNPMAITGVGQGLSAGLMLGSPGVLMYALAAALVWNYWMRPAEERDLRQQFGAAFDSYCRVVGCWIPRWPALLRRGPGAGR